MPSPSSTIFYHLLVPSPSSSTGMLWCSTRKQRRSPRRGEQQDGAGSGDEEQPGAEGA